MQVYIVEGFFDLLTETMIRQGRYLNVSKQRGQQLIEGGYAIKIRDLEWL